MRVILLGAAAGGGFPQWNCWCPVCRAARDTPPRALARTQSSLAFSADGARWFLGNASPDVRAQIERLGGGTPATTRYSPVEGIVLTDAELDHTLGITLLREARAMQLWATRGVLDILSEDSRLLPVTQAFADMPVTELAAGRAAPLTARDGSSAGLTVEAVPVAGDPPRFARRDTRGHTSAVIVREPATGGACAFVPGCAALDDALLATLAAANLVFFDGTCWSDDEMITLGVSDRTATAMGHVPISGARGSLERLRPLAAGGRTRVVYTHLNNTNPVLLDGSAERRAVEAAGITVGADGMTFPV
jgi:pyrroloquinoline quinone biosynthesis protein B